MTEQRKTHQIKSFLPPGKFDKIKRSDRLAASRERTLSDWVGRERKADVLASFRAPAKKVDLIIDELMERFDPKGVDFLQILRNSWTELLGEKLAAQAKPVALQENVLTLEVANTSWFYIFERQYKEEIRQKLLKATNNEITDLRFVQRGRFSR
jgi:predicted nucleic acid-binding Zn ribbon protein